MALASVGSLGSNNLKVAGTSLTVAILAGVSIGDIVAVWIGADNTGTTDGDLSEITSVTDAGGNTYVKGVEQTNGNGTAAEGVTGALYYSNISTGLSIANLITITFANSITAKAASAWQFTKTASNTLAVEGTPQVSVGDAADPASMTLSSLTSREYLLMAFTAVEAPTSVTYTKDADYTAITSDGTTGGVAASNITIHGGFRIATLTSDTYDAATSAGRDNAQGYLALYEVSAVSRPNLLMLLGVS